MKCYYYLIVLLFLSCKGKDDDSSGTLEIDFPTEYNFTPGLNIPPRIQLNGSVAQDGNMILDFNLTDKDDETVIVRLFAWNEQTQAYDEVTGNASGDLGENVSTTGSKRISWPIEAGYGHLKLEASNATPPTLQDMVNEVSKARISTDIMLMDGVRHFSQGPELLEKTRAYIEFLFQEHEVQHFRQAFSRSGFDHENVIGSLAGKTEPEKHLQVSGHFDTIANTPGADDNASGTAGMLETMRILSLFEFDKSLDFLGFDLEESGLVGARNYVNLTGRNLDIEGLINFEMIGYTCRSAECEDKPLADTSIYNIAPPQFAALRQAFHQAGADYVPELRISSVEADGDPNFRRSDHAPFWDAGKPALFITDGANFRNPHYHQHTDTESTIDYDFASQIVKTAVVTLARLAGWRDRGIEIIPL